LTANLKEHDMKFDPKRLAIGAMVLTLGVAGCTLPDWWPFQASQAAPAAPAQVAAANPTAASVPMNARGLPDFSVLVEHEGPAVVNISVTGYVKAQGLPEFPALNEDDPFLQFFKRLHPFGGQRIPQHGIGSGFILSPDGYVLTNAHVVDGASEVTVRLTDHREFKAKIVGADRRSDVALLKIDASGLPAVRIGNPNQAKVGEWVAAIGSPFGFENSITAGIISAKARTLPDESIVPFIQTDVAVNPGNSGGPLFNLNGEVIGVNSQIYSRSGGFMGVSFAIPIDVAMKVKDQLQSHGKASWGRLGVTIQPVTKAIADSFGLKETKGALVAAVDPNSPAEKAGVQSGDVIVALNGTAVEQSADLPRLVTALKPGDRAVLKVLREGKERELTATIGEMKNEAAAADDQPAAKPARLGVSVRPLAPEEQRDAGLKSGLVVEQVQGAAAQAGIQRGDIILRVNGARVESVAQLRDAITHARRSVALLVLRENQQIYVPVPLG
jgi:serine protease Do